MVAYLCWRRTFVAKKCPVRIPTPLPISTFNPLFSTTNFNMKLLTTLILSTALTTALTAPSWAETVKITIERQVPSTTASTTPASTSYTVEVGQSRVFDGMQTQAFAPTDGDCSAVDTSKLAREAKQGELLRVRTSRLVDDHVLIALDYEHRKFLGTTQTPYNLTCKVNNPASQATSFEASASLRKGAPPLLLRANAEIKVFGVIEP